MVEEQINVNSQKEPRASGIELYRIITMFLIVAHHYVVNSGITSIAYSNLVSAQSIFLFLFGAWGKTGINCFVLITGYFMCTSTISSKKFFRLFFEVLFYNIIIYVTFLCLGYEQFSFSGLVRTLFPIQSVNHNFTSCFLLFYLTIPFLNVLIKNLSERQHVLLLILVLFMYTIIATISEIDVIMNYVTWFIVLYFISSYVRLYPKKAFEKKGLWGWIALITFILSAVSVVCCTKLSVKSEEISQYHFVSDSNKILALATAISSFLFFKNLKFKSRFINKIASTMFGVLLIHANSDAMRRFLWQDLLNVSGYYNSSWLILHAFGSVIAIMIICILIDLIRITFIEKPLMKAVEKKFCLIDDFIIGKSPRNLEKKEGDLL